MTKVKLIKKHSAGKRRVNDRIEKDGKKKKFVHFLEPNDFQKSFEVHDVDYVMEKHGAIIERL